MSNINELIKQSGLQRKEIAAKLNVSQATISDWSTGKKTPRGNNLQNLSILFDVPYSVILGYDPLPDGTQERTSPINLNLNDLEDQQLLDAYHELTKAGKEYIKQQFVIAQKIYQKSDSIPDMEGVG